MVDCNFFNKSAKLPTEFLDSKGKKVILAVGRLSFQKDFSTLVKAIHIIKSEFKKGDVVSFIVGEGEEEYQLRELIQNLNLTNNVHLLGYRDNVADYMSHADVFVSSSIFEGFGLTIVEAMACGCPVVATDCKYGPREILEDGRNGILIPVGNPVELARAIILLLDNPDMVQKFAQDSRKHVCDFASDEFIREYEKLFNSI